MQAGAAGRVIHESMPQGHSVEEKIKPKQVDTTTTVISESGEGSSFTLALRYPTVLRRGFMKEVERNPEVTRATTEPLQS